MDLGWLAEEGTRLTYQSRLRTVTPIEFPISVRRVTLVFTSILRLEL